jgi:hypothetical protein
MQSRWHAQGFERFICSVSDLRFTGVHWAFRENRVFHITPCNAIFVHALPLQADSDVSQISSDTDDSLRARAALR